MNPLPSAADAALTHDDVVSIRVRADYSHLATLRGIARTVAHNAGLDIDEAADLALAMDEIASILIGHADPASDLVCRFNQSDTVLTVSVAGSTRTVVPDKSGTFSWFVLQSLVDSVEMTQTETGMDQHSLQFTLEKELRQAVV